MNSRNRIRRMFVIPLGLLILEGCGIYSFSGSTLPPDIKTVAIPIFENKTAEFGIDQQVTDLLTESIAKDNTLKIAGLRAADALIKGAVMKVEDRAGQYDQEEQASDFRVYLTVQVSFENVKKRKTLWEETLTQWGSYTDTRDDGIKQAVEKLSTDILNRTVSGW